MSLGGREALGDGVLRGGGGGTGGGVPQKSAFITLLQLEPRQSLPRPYISPPLLRDNRLVVPKALCGGACCAKPAVNNARTCGGSSRRRQAINMSRCVGEDISAMCEHTDLSEPRESTGASGIITNCYKLCPIPRLLSTPFTTSSVPNTVGGSAEFVEDKAVFELLHKPHTAPHHCPCLHPCPCPCPCFPPPTPEVRSYILYLPLRCPLSTFQLQRPSPFSPCYHQEGTIANFVSLPQSWGYLDASRRTSSVEEGLAPPPELQVDMNTDAKHSEEQAEPDYQALVLSVNAHGVGSPAVLEPIPALGLCLALLSLAPVPALLLPLVPWEVQLCDSGYLPPAEHVCGLSLHRSVERTNSGNFPRVEWLLPLLPQILIAKINKFEASRCAPSSQTIRRVYSA
ncbi:hypothetical protein JZ751_005193 [Albula glossodonta]|uniref:Uncharacterized protein n=1 Tax=Albula glossodonta TaxID=121402 RepID=A0A8T2PDA4_9TELE|nr:hypothetical protein JZ751_005193 [Albula glossodonta]